MKDQVNGKNSQNSAVSASQVRVYAKVTLDEMQIGVDANYVVLVQPRPASFTHLLRAEGALDGVFNLDGQVVPLIDLRRYMAGIELSTQRPEPAYVMVLRAEGGVFGLAIDSVNGLIRLPDSAVRQIHHDNAVDEFFHSVGVLDDGALISMVDPVRLMHTTRAWAKDTVANVKDSGNPALSTCISLAGSTPAKMTPAMVLVQIRATKLAVDAVLVAEVCARPHLELSNCGTGALQGVMEWHGHHVPVVDPGKALGLLHDIDLTTGRLVVVLAQNDRHVALPIDSVIAVSQLDSSKIQLARDIGMASGGFFAGVAKLAEDALLLLAGDALLSRYGFDGSLVHVKSMGKKSPQASVADPEAYVIFNAKNCWALPISWLEEITVLPNDYEVIPGENRLADGKCTWRGKTLPVIDLCKGDLDQPPREQRLVVVRYKDRLAGLRVNDMVALLPANSVTQVRVSLPGIGSVAMLTTTAAENRQSYVVLNLGSLHFFAESDVEAKFTEHEMVVA